MLAPEQAVAGNTAPSVGSNLSSLPDLLLVLLPGLRADEPAMPGAEEAFFQAMGSPAALRFSNAYVQSTHPFASAASILTGMYPCAIPVCGLYENSDLDTDAQRPWCASIPEDRPTIPRVLQIYGYRTDLVSVRFPGADILASEFQTWDDADETWGEDATDWQALTTRTVQWFSRDRDRPSFLVVAAADMMVGYRPKLRKAMGLASYKRNQFAIFSGESGDPGAISALYTQAATLLARGLGSMLDSLRGSSGNRPLWSVVTSTNGINLGEWSVGTHAAPMEAVLLEGTLHVPLAVLPPESIQESSVRSQVTELRSIAPTLLGLAGATLPAGATGHDLLAGLPREQAENATAYAAFGDMLSLRLGRYLLTFRCFLHGRTALDPELTERLRTSLEQPLQASMVNYRLNDIVRDPFQYTDLTAREAARFLYMQKLLAEHRLGAAAPPASAWDPQRLWKLRMSPADGYW